MFPLSPRVLHSWFPYIYIIQEKAGFGKTYLIQSLNIILNGDEKVPTQGQRLLCKQQIWKEQVWRQLMKRRIITTVTVCVFLALVLAVRLSDREKNDNKLRLIPAETPTQKFLLPAPAGLPTSS